MFKSTAQDDLPKILARSFIQAWERYCRSVQGTKVSEEVARPSLAKHLVARANEGMRDEEALATAGLLHLISLVPEEPPWAEFRLGVVQARFLHQWNVRMPASPHIRANPNPISSKPN